MKRYTFFFVAFLLSFSSIAQHTEELKKIEFGFNIHYLTEVEKYDKALKQIQQDGFTKIRAFEPFTDSLSLNTSTLLSKIEFIRNYRFELLLSLSNFIWKPNFIPEINSLTDKNQEFINEALKYTNRFPPGNESEFKSFLKIFFDSLQARGQLETMSFEIGNEPDADRYFWGSIQDWKKITLLIDDILKAYNVSVSCCGFSSDLIFNKSAGRNAFLEYINSADLPDNTSFSYHLYFETFLGKAELDFPQSEKIKNGIITEFAPFSNLPTDQKDLQNSSQMMKHLVSLLAFTYTNDVNTVYLFPLMDKAKHNTHMGYFDSEGNQKNAYNYLLKLRYVVNNGYAVYKTDDYTEIRGKESILRLAEQSHKINTEDVVFCSCKKLKKNRIINKGEWLVYKK